MGTHLAELLDPGKGPENGVISHLDVSRQRGTVGKNRTVSKNAVMGDVNTRHEQVVISNNSFVDPSQRAPIDCDKFSDSIPIADSQPRGLAFVFQVLGNRSNR